MPRAPRETQTEVEVTERIDVGQRVSIGLIALSLSLISLGLGLAFLNSPSALLVLPSVNLSVAPSSATAVTLTWTAPGDDGDVGQADSYEIRYSTAPITAANFSSATLVSSPPIPQPAGSTETYSITGLDQATTYFFALKSSDEAGNVSLISNVATKTTDAEEEACVPTYSCTAWSACVNGQQTRTCTVTNGCDSDLDQPATTQSCTSPDPEPEPVGGEDPHVIQNPQVVAGVAVNSIPVVRTIDYRRPRILREWLSFSRNDRNGVHVATGDVTGNNRADVIVGTGTGSDPLVRVYSDRGQLITQFNPYQTSRGIGVAVETADVNGDGREEILTIPSRSASHLRIFEYNSSRNRFEAIAQTFVYETQHRNGFTVAASDLNLDGKDEIIVSARTTALTVTVLRMNSNRSIQPIAKFSPYARVFHSGITLAAGDVNGDGRGEIITTPGPDLWSHIKVFSMTGKQLYDFLPTSTAYRGGVDLATFDVDRDGREEILTGTYSRGDPGVWAFRYNGLTKRFDRIRTFFVYPRTMQDGLRLDASPHI